MLQTRSSTDFLEFVDDDENPALTINEINKHFQLGMLQKKMEKNDFLLHQKYLKCENENFSCHKF